MDAPRPKGYSALQIGLHWTVAALVLLQFVSSSSIDMSWRAYVRHSAAPTDSDFT